MGESLEKEVEKQLQSGKGKTAILQEVATEENRAKVIFFLNNKALPYRRKNNQYIVLFLATILVFLTAKRLLVAFSYGRFDLFLFLDLVVPAVNVYVLREILRFQRIGFQFLALLAALSLFRQENRIVPDVYLYCTMAVLSLFLFYRMFPGKEILREG